MMLRLWLDHLVKQLFPSSRRRGRRARKQIPQRPAVEVLESRTLPATKTWALTTGGSWTTGANWSGGTVPANGDTIIIPDLTGSQTITFNTTVSVTGIQSGETLS